MGAVTITTEGSCQAESGNSGLIVLALRELGGYLSGVTLHVEGDGCLADHVLSIMATKPPDASDLAQHD